MDELKAAIDELKAVKAQMEENLAELNVDLFIAEREYRKLAGEQLTLTEKWREAVLEAGDGTEQVEFC